MSAGAVAGLGLWSSFGVLAVEFAGERAPRLGVLPHPGYLLSAVLLLTAGTFFVQRYTRLQRVSDWYFPLFCSAIVAVPWLPVPLPAGALVWAGPAALWVWGAVTIALAVTIARSGVFPTSAWCRRRLESSRAAWTATTLAVVIYGAAALYLAPVFPGGDEPHYLVIAQSLLKDGDIKIENNHRQEDYLEYFRGVLTPHYLKRGIDGEIYSVHAPGLPALLVPAYAVGGYPAVVAFLLAVAGLLSILVWRTAFLATGKPGAAWFGWASVMLSAPVLFHAFAVYPETTGAALVMAGVATLIALDRVRAPAGTESSVAGPSLAGPWTWPWWRWLLLGAGLALLPWLHTRYVILACVLGGALAGRLFRGSGAVGRLLSLSAVPAVSAVAWLSFFKAVYGTFNPAAPYGHYTQTKLAYVPHGLPALLFDQQFGLLPNAPVFAVAIIGFVALGRVRLRLAVELLSLVLSCTVVVAAYQMWWGGWSAPARFLVPVLPVLAVPAAAWWNSRQAGGRLAGGTLLGLGLLVSSTALLAGRGMLIFNPRDAVSRLYEWLSPLVDANRALPSFFRPESTSPLLIAAIWVSVLAAGAIGLSWAVRRLRPDATAVRCTGAITVAALLITVALEISWRVQRVQPFSGTASQLALLEAAASSPSGIGISPLPFGIENPAQLVTRLRLSPSDRRTRGPSEPAYTLAPVPPGVYRLDNTSIASVTGTLSVRIGRGEVPVETWAVNPETRTVDRRLRLACSVNAVVIDVEHTERSALSRLTLQPVEVWPGDGCPDQRARLGTRYGSAFVLFFDENAYAEDQGFWVRGGAETQVAVTPDGNARAVRLGIRGGAVAVRVRIVSGDWRDEVVLGIAEQRGLDVPVESRTGAALIMIRPDTGFVPSRIDRASRDRRFLGCWVTIRE